MKVFLYTGGFTHTLYREQALALPPGVQLVGSSGDLHATAIKADLLPPGPIRRRVFRPMKRAALSTFVRIGVPNVRYIHPPDCDLIHSAQYPLLNRHPWVIDFEDASVFAWYDPSNLRRPHVRRILERLFEAPACRWILPWSNAARQSLFSALDCRGFADKIRVVYPAIRPAARVARRNGESVRLLFVGSAFYYKGGLETLLAFQRLSTRVRARLTVVSFVPAEVRKRFAGTPGLVFQTRVNPQVLQSLYESADIFVAPFHTDTFGFVLLEALARGIPCVVTNQFAIPEIVTDGVTGVVVENSASRFGDDCLPRYSLLGKGPSRMLHEVLTPDGAYVDRLAAAIEYLATDRRAHLAMSEAAYREVSVGRFSFQARKAALAGIYTG